jgi:hypothetical protein
MDPLVQLVHQGQQELQVQREQVVQPEVREQLEVPVLPEHQEVLVPLVL